MHAQGVNAFRCSSKAMIYRSKKALGGEKMELVEEAKELRRETAKDLKGSKRRLCIVRTVRALGEGSQRWAQRE